MSTPPPTVSAEGFMGMHLTAEALVIRAARNAGRRERRRPRWSHVAEVFAIGSTSACKLCRLLDLDPDEQVGTDPDDEDES